MYTFNNLTFKHVLNIKDLVINHGEITGLIGPSGAGKSTLLKHLNLMLSATSGSLSYNDKDITSYQPSTLRRNVMMLPQSPYIYDGSIYSNLIIGFSYKKEPIPSNEEIINILRQVKLSQALESDASVLSGGEKQRLALARILLMKPQVLLLDEPSSALDKKLEIEILDIIKNYQQQENITVILITHNQDLVYDYSDRIITLEAGHVSNIEVIS